MRHFGTINKNTILNKTFCRKAGDKVDNYLKLPLFPQNTRNSDVVKMKRKFVLSYDTLGWAKKAITDYDRLMQGLLDSYLCFRDRQLSLGVVEVTTGFVEQLRRVFPSAQVNAIEFPSLPEFIRRRGTHTRSDDLSSPFISKENISFIKMDMSHARNGGSSGSSRNFLDMVARYRESGFGSSIYCFVIVKDERPDNTDTFRIFDFEHTMTGYGNALPTDNVSSSERYLQRLGTNANCHSIEYIAAELPEDYDAAYNAQSWLNLTDRTTGEPCLDGRNTLFMKYSHPVWEVESYDSSNSHTGALESIHTNFIGNWPDGEVKNDLSSYGFTTDDSLLGKGRIYVDADGVCYCPVSGYPLKCVYSNYDYKNITSGAF